MNSRDAKTGWLTWVVLLGLVLSMMIMGNAWAAGPCDPCVNTTQCGGGYDCWDYNSGGTATLVVPSGYNGFCMKSCLYYDAVAEKYKARSDSWCTSNAGYPSNECKYWVPYGSTVPQAKCLPNVAFVTIECTTGNPTYQDSCENDWRTDYCAIDEHCVPGTPQCKSDNEADAYDPETNPNPCSNGEDDDLDGYYDCLDSDCDGALNCAGNQCESCNDNADCSTGDLVSFVCHDDGYGKVCTQECDAFTCGPGATCKNVAGQDLCIPDVREYICAGQELRSVNYCNANLLVDVCDVDHICNELLGECELITALESVCNDGFDDNFNGLTDCDDLGCRDYPDCPSPEVVHPTLRSNHGGGIWHFTAADDGTEISDYHYNISEFIIDEGVTINVSPQKKLYIKANKITINGTIDADEAGMPGGKGSPTKDAGADGSSHHLGGNAGEQASANAGRMDPQALEYVMFAFEEDGATLPEEFYFELGGGFGTPGGQAELNLDDVPSYCSVGCDCGWTGSCSCNKGSGAVCSGGGGGGGTGGGYMTNGCQGNDAAPGFQPTSLTSVHCNGGDGGSGAEVTSSFSDYDRYGWLLMGSGGAGGGSGAGNGSGDGAPGGDGGGAVALEATEWIHLGANAVITANGGSGLFTGTASEPDVLDGAACENCDEATGEACTNYYFGGGCGGGSGSGSGGGILLAAPDVSLNDGASLSAKGGVGHNLNWWQMEIVIDLFFFVIELGYIVCEPTSGDISYDGAGGAGVVKVFDDDGVNDFCYGDGCADISGCGAANVAPQYHALQDLTVRVRYASDPDGPDVDTYPYVVDGIEYTGTTTLSVVPGGEYSFSAALTHSYLDGDQTRYSSFVEWSLDPYDPLTPEAPPKTTVRDYMITDESVVTLYVLAETYYLWDGSRSSEWSEPENWQLCAVDSVNCTPDSNGYPAFIAPCLLPGDINSHSVKVLTNDTEGGSSYASTLYITGDLYCKDMEIGHEANVMFAMDQPTAVELDECHDLVMPECDPGDEIVCFDNAFVCSGFGQCVNSCTEDWQCMLIQPNAVCDSNVCTIPLDQRCYGGEFSCVDSQCVNTCSSDSQCQAANPKYTCEGSTCVYNPASEGASNLTIGGTFVVRGDLGGESDDPIEGNVITVNGNTQLGPLEGQLGLAQLYLNNATIVANGNLVVTNRARIYRENAVGDTDAAIQVGGGLVDDPGTAQLEATLIDFRSQDYDAGLFRIQLAGADRNVQLESSFGPIIDEQISERNLGVLDVARGVLHIGGNTVTLSESLQVGAEGKVVLGASSSLRVIGNGDLATAKPIVLSDRGALSDAIVSDGGSLWVGPFNYNYAISVPAAHASVIDFGVNARVTLNEGTFFYIDNLEKCTGWDLDLDQAAYLVADQTRFEIDNDLTITSPGLLNVTDCEFNAGAGYQEFDPSNPVTCQSGEIQRPGDFTVTDPSSTCTEQTCSIDAATEIEFPGFAFSTMGEFEDIGGKLVPTSDGAEIGGNAAFDELRVNVDLVIPSGASPIFEDLVYVQNDGKLEVRPGGVLRFGNDAVMEVWGELDMRGTYVSDTDITYAMLSHRLDDETSTYTVNIELGGTIKASYAIFEYMGVTGLTVKDGATVDVTDNFSHCRFRYSYHPSSYRMLAIDNSQELIIDGARFISNVHPSSFGGLHNAAKQYDQGVLVFINERCDPDNVPMDNLDCVGGDNWDISGELYDQESYVGVRLERIYWTPGLSVSDYKAVVYDRYAPLNSEKSYILFGIENINNPTSTEYCIKDNLTDVILGSDYRLSAATCDANWGNKEFWGGGGGVMIEVPDRSSFQFAAKSRLVIENDVGGPLYTYPASDWVVSDATVGPTGDRTPSDPTAAAAVIATPQTIDPEDRNIGLAWGLLGDPGAGEDSTWDVKFAALRGVGPNSLGDMAGLPNHGHVLADVPSDFTPVKGFWDNFEMEYEGAPPWQYSPQCAWTRENSVLKGENPGQSGCAEGEYYSRILFKPPNDVIEYYDELAGGYVMTFDLKRTGGSGGPEVTFLLDTDYTGDPEDVVNPTAARWQIGVMDDQLVPKSKLFHSGDAASNIEDFSLVSDRWYQVMIYVYHIDDVTNGSVHMARGYVNGQRLWEIDLSSGVTGNAAANLNWFGFMLHDSEVEIDNLMVAPLLDPVQGTVDVGNGPETRWTFTDDDAKDLASPITPDFTFSDITAIGGEAIQVTVVEPDAADGNNATYKDQGSAYFYYVLGFDSEGNVSNYVRNPGFEGLNVDVWQGTGPDDDPLRPYFDETEGVLAEALEGRWLGTIALPFSKSVTMMGVQNIQAPYVAESMMPGSSILRFQRYFKINDYTDGSVFPATFTVNFADASSSTAVGMEFASVTDGWLIDTARMQLDQTDQVASLQVFSQPSGATPNYELSLDQARLDVITGQAMWAGYNYTQIEYNAEFLGGKCDFAELKVDDGEGGWKWPESGTVTDNWVFQTANERRFYRIRSCDATGGEDDNCGDWRGGHTCNSDAECVALNKDYIKCVDFDGHNYCARCVDAGCSTPQDCVPGVEVYSSAVPPANPLLATKNTDFSTFQNADPDGNALVLAWDNGAGTLKNSTGTEYQIRGLSAENAAECSSCNPYEETCSTSVRVENYWNPISESFTANASEDATWSMFEINMVKRKSAGRMRNTGSNPNNLDPQRFYCFQVRAQNHNAQPTAWTAISNAVQPPARPVVDLLSVSVKYGQNPAGYDADSPFAMSTDGSTYQEVSFVVTDPNNVGTYSDLDVVGFRVLPHGDYDLTYMNGNLYSHMQRGDFRAMYTGSHDLHASSSWEFLIEAGKENINGNQAVDLLETGVDASFAAEVSAGNLVNGVRFTFRWTLDENYPSGYETDQDQGFMIKVADTEGIVTDWNVNEVGSCEKVFHTSYTPPTPVLASHGSPTVWINSVEPQLVVLGNLDYDRLDHVNLSTVCAAFTDDQGNPDPVCNEWGLTGPRAGWYNCIDADADSRDEVDYQVEIWKGEVSESAGSVVYGCKDGGGNLLASSPWFEDIATEQIEVGGVMQTFYGLHLNDSGASQSFDFTLPGDGAYCWLSRARDNHDYSPLATPVNSTEKTFFGVDTVAPDWETPATALTVKAKTEEGSQFDVPDTEDNWMIENDLKFYWDPARRDPLSAPPAENETAPIAYYHYTITPHPTDRSQANMAGNLQNEGQALFVYPPSAETWQQFLAGIYEFQVTAFDEAGNESDALDFTIRIDWKNLSSPCLHSTTHPNETYVYCNDGSYDVGGEVPVYDPTAPTPIIRFMDPVVANKDAFVANDICCQESGGCSCNDVVTDCDWALAHSEIVAYSFTFREDTVSPDINYEWEDDAPAEGVCDAYMRCYDSQQPDNFDDRFSFTFLPSRYQLADGSYLDCGEDDVGDPSPWRCVQYFVSNADGEQQSGSYFVSLYGWSEIGSRTELANWQFNVCGCNEDNCKNVGGRKDDGRAMAFFDGGELDMTGSAGGEGGSSVNVDPFYLDESEVANADYAKCVADEVCPDLADAFSGSKTRDSYYKSETFATYPVVNVDWDSAQAYCAWAEKRLPTEIEWLYAAQQILASHPDGLEASFPSELIERGDTDPVDAVHGPILTGKLTLLNLFDNVSEWTSSWWSPDLMVPTADEMDIEAIRAQCLASCAAAADGESAEPVETEDTALSMTGRETVQTETEHLAAENLQLADPACAAACQRKTVRGGSFEDESISLDLRKAVLPGDQQPSLGFRCARDVGENDEELSRDASIDSDSGVEPIDQSAQVEPSIDTTSVERVHLRR